MSNKTKSLIGLLIAIIVVALAVYFITRPGDTHAQNGAAPAPPSSAAASQTPTAAPTLNPRTKTSGCVLNNLPDKNCTPGAVMTNATKDQICVKGYSSGVRDVPVSEKNVVYAEYGITAHSAGEYEIDHLISLELGGSNDISNLWPEAASPKPGFHEKDATENYLHDQVCKGAVSLAEAQRRIADDWISVYRGLPAAG